MRQLPPTPPPEGREPPLRPDIQWSTGEARGTTFLCPSLRGLVGGGKLLLYKVKFYPRPAPEVDVEYTRHSFWTRVRAASSPLP